MRTIFVEYYHSFALHNLIEVINRVEVPRAHQVLLFIVLGNSHGTDRHWFLLVPVNFEVGKTLKSHKMIEMCHEMIEMCHEITIDYCVRCCYFDSTLC